MPVSLRIEPSDFAVPTGPAVISVKIDREALQHLDPSMNPSQTPIASRRS